ncbi:MAG: hypothetical protein LBH13_06835 [Cellulomonadaceae bacterium]|jgi:hypothetical protein|nr:hypothetical protein [Cellulomonadaceae bacterium]
MYAALWRALPGPAAVKALILLALFAAALWVCVEWVFPWLANYMPFNDSTVHG